MTIAHKQFYRFFDPPRVFEDVVYTRKGFNKYGDIVAHANLFLNNDTHFKERMDPVQSIGFTGEFTKLSEQCKAQGARLFIVFSNYPRSQYERNKAVSSRHPQKIKTDLDFIPILGAPETFL